jgi:hypothetical protein
MKNAIINKGIIKKIALALGELNEQVIYVGGATVGLYINDPAADDVRPTKGGHQLVHCHYGRVRANKRSTK